MQCFLHFNVKLIVYNCFIIGFISLSMVLPCFRFNIYNKSTNINRNMVHLQLHLHGKMKPNRIDRIVDSTVCIDWPAITRQTKSVFILWGHSWYRLPATAYISKVCNLAHSCFYCQSMFHCVIVINCNPLTHIAWLYVAHSLAHRLTHTIQYSVRQMQFSTW